MARGKDSSKGGSAGGERPPSYRDIAARAGVSVATVSMAMRDDPRITAPVRERIRELARAMGYRVNPLLSVYQTAVRAGKAREVQATLGWISDHPNKDFWGAEWNRPLLEGARMRAAELGFALDEIWIPGIREEDPADNLRRWERILKARGIRGVVLPLMDRAHHAVLSWEGYSVVCVGRHFQYLRHSKIPPSVMEEHHCVNEDAYRNVHIAVENLRRLGYRRIGLALAVWEDRGTDSQESAAFLRAASDWPARQRVPVLYSDHAAEVAAWALKHQPDAVICASKVVRDGLTAAGLKVPEDVGVAHLNLAADVAGWSGIDRRQRLIGSAAIDMLVAHLQRNETGVPPFAKSMAIEGVWVDGATTRGA